MNVLYVYWCEMYPLGCEIIFGCCGTLEMCINMFSMNI